MSYDENNRDNRPDVTDEAECGSTEYTFDDIASEISYVGNTTHFDELDEYSDDLESSEINGTTMAESDYSDDFDLLNYDEDIPEDVLNDPEKLLKYLSSNKSGFVSKDERNSSQSVKDVEAQQITLDSMEENEPVNIQESKPVSYDIGIPQPAGIATVDKKPHIDVSNVEPIDCSWIEEPSVIDTHKTDSSDELSGEKPLADVVQDLETLVGDLFEGASLANEVSVEETTENDVSEEKPLSDVVQDLETAINGLFDDEQEAEPVVNYDDNRETSIGEAHEPETLASDMPEEDPVVSEMIVPKKNRLLTMCKSLKQSQVISLRKNQKLTKHWNTKHLQLMEPKNLRPSKNKNRKYLREMCPGNPQLPMKFRILKLLITL